MSDPAKILEPRDAAGGEQGRGPQSSLRAAILVATGLAVTFAAYIGTLLFQFVYDDRGQVLENRLVHSWHYLPLLFTKQVWVFAAPQILGNYYRPVFLLWFLLVHTFFGLNPMGWHLVTLVAHLAVTLLVYRLVRRIAHDRWVAIIAALVFGVHPAHIESVAWVSGVTDPLLALCLLPSFLFYLNWRESRPRRWRWLAASLAFYLLTLLAKETGVILPVLIFAYEWIWAEDTPAPSRLERWGRRFKTAVVRILPYAVPTLVYMIARVLVLGGFAHVLYPLPISTILMTWPFLLMVYLKHLLWPFGLCVFYNLPYISRPSSLQFILPMILIVLVATGLWAWHRRLARTSAENARVLAFACAWLIVPFMPLTDLSLLAKGESLHDRYLYLPMIGFGILIGLAVHSLPSSPIRVFGEPAFQCLAFLALAAFLGTATSNQELYWANDLLLYSRGVTVDPSNNIAMRNLASVYGELNQDAVAIRLYHTVLRRDPDDWLAIYNLGYTYYRLGRLPEAEHFLRLAIARDISKGSPDEFFYLGMILLKKGQPKEAELEFRRAIQIRSDGLAYHLALGLALKQQGDLAGALREFRSEEKNHPGEAAARQQAALIEGKIHSP
jgi:protein O-mannosyl-transferase